jgi:hypothetical protein
MSHPELDEEELLVLNHAAQMERQGDQATFGSIRALLGDASAAPVTQSLTNGGYLVPSKKSVRPYTLSQDGKKAINAYRRQQAREELLTWLYGFAHGSAADPAGFTGASKLAPYTSDETQAAVEFLLEKKLATTQRGAQAADGSYVAVWISERGRECFEAPGDLADLLNRSDQVAATYQQHFHAPFTGQAAQGQNVQQGAITVTVDNFDLGKVRQIAAAVRQCRDVLQLPAEVDSSLITAEQSEDREAVHQAARDLRERIAPTGTGPLGAILSQELARVLGIA